jgi:hypothetical protein
MRCAFRVSFLLTLAVLLSPALGCGGVNYKFAPVSGQITMDNKPLADATISFYPNAGGDLPAAKGRTDEQGNYKLQSFANGRSEDGALVGESRVEISINMQNSSHKLLAGPGRPKLVNGGEILPARYNKESTLKFTVPPEGTDKADFPLTSKAR